MYYLLPIKAFFLGLATVASHFWLLGKSMCISEVHGGAGLGCGPASAHYIAEQKLFIHESFVLKGFCYTSTEAGHNCTMV